MVVQDGSIQSELHLSRYGSSGNLFFLRGLYIFLFLAHADRDEETSRDFGFFVDGICLVVDSPASASWAFGEARIWDSYVHPIHLQHSVGTLLICLEKTVY